MKIIAQNKKARHDYHVLEKLEAGIVLVGTEVKSCRAGGVSLVDAHARVVDGELWLVGVHIAEYSHGNQFNHPPTRERKLLVHRREVARLRQATEAKGITLVPLALYFSQGKVKVELALCKGKDKHDKREALREKEHDREARVAMGKG